MIASRFRVVGWVAGVVAALLLCYLASQSVAGERAALAKVDRQIADTKGDIQRLTMEIGTRSRMGQLEHWNTEAFALQAPAPKQFVADEVQLVNLVVGKPLPLDPAIVASRGATQVVSYRPSAAPEPAPAIAAPPAPMVTMPREQPLLRVASYVKPKMDRLTDPDEAPLVRTSLDRLTAGVLKEDATDKPAKPRRVKIANLLPDDFAAPAEAKAVKPHRARAASLLPDDLGALVADERKAKGKVAHP